MSNTLALPGQVAVHQHSEESYMEGVLLEGMQLRVERVKGPDKICETAQLLDLLAPLPGYNYRVCWPYQTVKLKRTNGEFVDLPFELATDLAIIRFLFTEREGQEFPGEVTGPFPQNIQFSYALHVAQRRRVGRFIHVTFTQQGAAVCASDSRGAIDMPACDFWDVRNATAMMNSCRSHARVGTALRRILKLKGARDWLWIATGSEAGCEAPAIADKAGAKALLIPAHAGAAASLGVLLGNASVSAERYGPRGAVPDKEVLGPKDRLRVIMLELMDEVANHVTRMGYDLDDTTCERYVIARASPRKYKHFPFSASANGSDELTMPWDKDAPVYSVGVIATVDLRKPVLPPVVLSSTFPGAGEPERRVVMGPGKMLACLCEIDVPAGWRAEWEPSGDVMMTRV